MIGAALAVHRELGAGFLEAVYHAALKTELVARRIPFRSEVGLAIFYRGAPLKLGYRADLVCFDALLVELKAQSAVGVNEQAQVLNYLKASGLPRGLLLNFGAPSLQIKRFVHSSNL